MQKSVYKQTTEVYNNLGIRYLKDSKKINPPERLPFSKLFSKGNLILDVGCGGGRDAKFFNKKGLEVVGIDTSSVMIKLAKKEVPKANFQCINLLNIKFKKDMFDGVWAQAVLLHLKRKDIPKALKIFYKILKPNGILHISIREGKGETLEKYKLLEKGRRLYTYFSKNEIIGFLEKQGFKVIYLAISHDIQKRPNINWIRIWAKK